MRVEIPKPWLGFIRDVDRELRQPIEIHCLGGFVLAVLWNLPRPTGDVDIIEVRPAAAGEELMRIAGEGSELARHYQIHFQWVTVAEYPEETASRMYPVPVLCRNHRATSVSIGSFEIALVGGTSRIETIYPPQGRWSPPLRRT